MDLYFISGRSLIPLWQCNPLFGNKIWRKHQRLFSSTSTTRIRSSLSSLSAAKVLQVFAQNVAQTSSSKQKKLSLASTETSRLLNSKIPKPEYYFPTMSLCCQRTLSEKNTGPQMWKLQKGLVQIYAYMYDWTNKHLFVKLRNWKTENNNFGHTKSCPKPINPGNRGVSFLTSEPVWIIRLLRGIISRHFCWRAGDFALFLWVRLGWSPWARQDSLCSAFPGMDSGEGMWRTPFGLFWTPQRGCRFLSTRGCSGGKEYFQWKCTAAIAM